MSPRVRFLVSGAVTILILALVIFGLWAFTTPKNQAVTPQTITLSPAQQSDKAYQDALKALSLEQTGTAIGLLQKAVRLNPANTAAKKALADATSSSAGTSNSSSTTGSTSTTKKPAKKTTPATASGWNAKIKLLTLVPYSFTDYAVSGAEAQANGTSADISATANKPSATVTTIEWTVLDRGTAAKATSFITSVSKKAYPLTPATVAVNGVNAYFGTNKVGLGTVAYTRGRYAFEVIITSKNPANDQATAVQAASVFPTQP